MGSSFTTLQKRGFWAPDGHLEVWLAALADVVSPDAPQWLLDARRHWRTQARTGFQGCVDAGLDRFLTAPDRVETLRQLSGQAREFLVQVGGHSCRVPAEWLNERRVGGSAAWSDDLGLAPILRVADTFAQLLGGESQAAAGPALLHLIREQPPGRSSNGSSPSAGVTEPGAVSPPVPVWAITANVVEQRPFGPGGAVQRRGLKLFSGGAKVYVVDGFAGMGYETVTVVGRPRKSSRFSIVHVRAEHLTRWRVELVYSPAAMARIAEVREGGGGFSLREVPDPGASQFRDALAKVAGRLSAGTGAAPVLPQTGLAAVMSRRGADVLRVWRRLRRA